MAMSHSGDIGGGGGGAGRVEKKKKIKEKVLGEQGPNVFFAIVPRL